MASRARGVRERRPGAGLRLSLSQLRKKLEPDPAHPRYLLTEAGMGYRLRLPESDA